MITSPLGSVITIQFQLMQIARNYWNHNFIYAIFRKLHDFSGTTVKSLA